MSLRDIEVAVDSYKKLTKEERALFYSEIGKRRGKKPGPKVGSKRVKARLVADDSVPIKKAMKKAPEKVRRPRKTRPVDPLAQEQVVQEG